MLGRVGLAGIAGLLVTFAVAAPASAATTADLELRLTGTTLAAGAPDKEGLLTITNHGPGDASGIALVYDVSALDTDVVQLVGLDACGRDTDLIVCGIAPDQITTASEARMAVRLVKVPGATGGAGSITVTVRHSGTDPRPENNTVTAPVTIDASGPDLRAIALDVYRDVDPRSGPVPPGATARLWTYVQNQGDAPAGGLTATVTLPSHVSFAETLAGCAYDQPRRTATCTRADVVLEPEAAGWLFWDVTVAAGAPGPTALTGGSVAVAPAQNAAARAAVGSVGFTRQAPAGIELDVDPTDNTDTYTVFVAAPTASPSPSVSPSVSVAPAGGGGGGSLPITGVPVGLLAAVGAGAALAGLALLLLTSRRRVDPDGR